MTCPRCFSAQPVHRRDSYVCQADQIAALGSRLQSQEGRHQESVDRLCDDLETLRARCEALQKSAAVEIHEILLRAEAAESRASALSRGLQDLYDTHCCDPHPDLKCRACLDARELLAKEKP